MFDVHLLFPLICRQIDRMSPHRIHLKGPWHYEWVSPRLSVSNVVDRVEVGEFPGEGKVAMPASWQSIFGDVSGTVRFLRRFGRPTNLESDERVFIVFDGVGGSADIAVNDRKLGKFADPDRGIGFEVTNLLQESNQLVVELEFDVERAGGKPGGLWAPVAIEIRSD